MVIRCGVENTGMAAHDIPGNETTSPDTRPEASFDANGPTSYASPYIDGISVSRCSIDDEYSTVILAAISNRRSREDLSLIAHGCSIQFGRVKNEESRMQKANKIFRNLAKDKNKKKQSHVPPFPESS